MKWLELESELMLKYDSTLVGSYSLCKAWKADRIVSPFYDGSGKVQFRYVIAISFIAHHL